ncbi:MAG: hypothetical protein M3536_00060 [Actinomycetota bacterium]|nr:hypothetical protein [Actinomycetota bacterium]
MTSPKTTAHDIFWLARYAHNVTAPLFAQAKAIEPTISFSIEINFSEPGARFFETHAIVISAWWIRDGMFQMSSRLETKEAVDRFAAKVEGDVANLQPLETWIAA